MLVAELINRVARSIRALHMHRVARRAHSKRPLTRPPDFAELAVAPVAAPRRRQSVHGPYSDHGAAPRNGESMN